MRSFRILLCAILFSILVVVTAGSAAPIPQAPSQPAQSIEGSWEGSLNSPVGKLRLVLNVSKDSSGGFKATLDSPDQGSSNLPIDKITLTDSFVHFASPAGGWRRSFASQQPSRFDSEYRALLPIRVHR